MDVLVVIAHARTALIWLFDLIFNFDFEFHELTIKSAGRGRNGPSRVSRTGTLRREKTFT